MAPALRRFFRRQSERVTARLLQSLKAPPWDPLLFPPDEDSLLRRALMPYLERGIITSAELAAALVGANTPIGQSAFIRAALIRGSQRIVAINETTRNAVQELLSRGQQAGYNLYQLANGVPDDGFRGIRDVVTETYRNRAEAIARTEMGQASQTASHAQWRELGVRFVDIIDGDEDEPCASRNGTRVSIDEDVDLLHPNCTVVSLPVIEDVQEVPVFSEGHAGELEEYQDNSSFYNEELRLGERDRSPLDPAFEAGAVRSEGEVVYRGTDFGKLELNVGDVFIDKGFVSTSRDVQVASYAIPEEGGRFASITIPRGARVVDVDKLLPTSDWFGQQEILLNRSSKFRVDWIRGHEIGLTLL
jgi:hypothetical protein